MEGMERMMSFDKLHSFYEGKRVLVTGHTGFKGAWMCRVLKALGAKVSGYALAPDPSACLYEIARISDYVDSYIGDIADLEQLKDVFFKVQPEIVIHMAAQPLVRESYKNPVYTYKTNVLGTVNVLECIRLCPSVRSFVNVTTDKVYKNEDNRKEPFLEDEFLMGWDPYSNSKSCSELVTYSYVHSFLDSSVAPERKLAVSTLRAGNVIGGGDFATDRIIPDCYRASHEGKEIMIRNPYAIRPFQHVLEPVITYLYVAAVQYDHLECAGSYNIGPEDADCVNVGTLADLFCECYSDGSSWKNCCDHGPKEANFLKLDCSRIKKVFGWKCRFNIKEAVQLSVDWYKKYGSGEEIISCMDQQIQLYFN